MKKVYKYGTGQEIPDGAKYLCTKVEKTITVKPPISNYGEGGDGITREVNTFVWHYYEVTE